MAVHHGLTGDRAAVHAEVEALHSPVLGQDVEAELVKEEVDRRPLWFVQVEERGSIALRQDPSPTWPT